jgi:hypothetical protein
MILDGPLACRFSWNDLDGSNGATEMPRWTGRQYPANVWPRQPLHGHAKLGRMQFLLVVRFCWTNERWTFCKNAGRCGTGRNGFKMCGVDSGAAVDGIVLGNIMSQ